MPRIIPEFPATRDTFLVSLLTGRHTDDHGILANQMFFEATQNVTNLAQPLPWEHVKSLETIWVNYLIQVLCYFGFVKNGQSTTLSTLGVQIIVRRTIINFSNFSQPYFLIWDRTIIDFEINEIKSS